MRCRGHYLSQRYNLEPQVYNAVINLYHTDILITDIHLESMFNPWMLRSQPLQKCPPKSWVHICPTLHLYPHKHS